MSGDGPIVAAGLREASRTPLVTPEQEKPIADSVSAVREAAQHIPLGAKVNVRMRSGEKIHAGRLRAVSEAGIVIEKPRQSGWDGYGNRVGEPIPPTTVEVPYDALESIKRNRSTRNLLIGVGVVVGLLLAANGYSCGGNPFCTDEDD